MHVPTKVICNWTWQTFLWSHDPANPLSPCSTKAAALRPSELSYAAAHYALSTAYLFVTPNQPIRGGTNKGVSAMIGYNRYLVAVFNPGVFNFPNEFKKEFQYGIQTNCMSCYELAIGQPNKVQVDFAWSIQGAIIPDAPPPKNRSLHS